MLNWFETIFRQIDMSYPQKNYSHHSGNGWFYSKITQKHIKNDSA